MRSLDRLSTLLLRWMCWCLACFALAGSAQQQAGYTRQFLPGNLNRVEEVPASRLRARLDRLPTAARDRAMQHLRNFHFTELDLNSLETDSEGDIYYVDVFPTPDPLAPDDELAASAALPPATGYIPVPVTPFPANVAFHSKPGSPNVLYLNFSGATVANTAWNTSLGRTIIPARPFSTDSDYTTFSDSEQSIIQRVWLRVAEDYAPFDVDVTTEPPATMHSRIAEALITRNTDADGNLNPSSSAGGVAYVGVFGGSSYYRYRPAWIYHNNLGNNEAYIAEAAAHEIGHNLGLSHDGKTDGTEYYGGHGSGEISWGPIMGTGYGRNVSEWSKGEYYLANNTQDDLATIASRIPYRVDDHGNSAAAATPLTITDAINVVATRPDIDPANLDSANKGVLEYSTDVDVFSFVTGNGIISLSVAPWIQPAGTRGGNSDLLVELYDTAGYLIAANNPATQTAAQIQVFLPPGTYYLHIRNSGAGSPLSSSPNGFTAYGSLGQYFISGYTSPALAPPPPPTNLRVVFD